MVTENISERNYREMLDMIINNEYIYPVYQPIISLADGQVFGYEALSRISGDSFLMHTEELFTTADKLNRAWELEALCRTKALKGAVDMGAGKKLFLNVNPNIIHDYGFREGFTKDRLEEYGLDYRNIVFEITERVAISDNSAFFNAIKHYKAQNYEIAIDDVGAGYSGLNIIAMVKPNHIKLDMNLIRDIDKDETKQLLCKALVYFGKNAGIKLIAEGIETAKELEMLIKFEVDFGQGYFLGIPKTQFSNIAPEKIKEIMSYNEKYQRTIPFVLKNAM